MPNAMERLQQVRAANPRNRAQAGPGIAGGGGWGGGVARMPTQNPGMMKSGMMPGAVSGWGGGGMMPGAEMGGGMAEFSRGMPAMNPMAMQAPAPGGAMRRLQQFRSRIQ